MPARRDRGDDAAVVAVVVALAVWVLATATGQHPNQNFDRVRGLDRASVLLPNWRFFAPVPANKDVVLLHRVRRDGRIGEWQHTHLAPARRFRHVLWFPERRVDKGIFDVVGRFLRTVEQVGVGFEDSPDYQMLAGFVRRRVLLDGADGVEAFQFAIARESGYADEPLEEIFVSRKEVLAPHAATHR